MKYRPRFSFWISNKPVDSEYAMERWTIYCFLSLLLRFSKEQEGARGILTTKVLYLKGQNGYSVEVIDMYLIRVRQKVTSIVVKNFFNS